MKKTILAILMVLTGVFTLQAQITKDLLYLKNGNMIFGKLLELNDSIYKIQTSDGSIYLYPRAEVDKFVSDSQGIGSVRKNICSLTVEGGIMAGAQGSKYDAPFSFNFLVNLTKKPKYILSIGSGVEFLGQAYTPLFAEYKIMFSEKPVTPFIFIRGGKLFHINGDVEATDQTTPQYNVPTGYKGGGTFTIGTGISWVKEWGETYLSFGYRNLHTSYQVKNTTYQISTYKTSYNRLEIKYGIRF
jgi:hypothetical protein